jgi:hypothetical protein
MTLKDKILQSTNGGRDILCRLFPEFHENKQFKAEDDERTPSAKARFKNNVWEVCVFDPSRGKEASYQNAIDWYMHRNHITDFVDGMKALCAEYGIDTSNGNLFNQTEVIDEKREHTGFRTNIITRAVKPEEAKVIGRFVDPAICKKFKIETVVSYDYTDRSGVTRRTYGTELNPHFLLGMEGKIYAPKSPDKRYRYMATRPLPESRDTVWGSDLILSEYEDDQLNDQYIIICCGYRDAVNVASLGYEVVWMSAEGLAFPFAEMKKLQKLGATIVYCADLDRTGQDAAHSTCSIFLDVHRLYLPEWLKLKKDHRGNACKDVTDFIKNSGKNFESCKSSFQILINNASPYRFWYSYETKDGERTKISRTWLKRFVIANGFARYKFDDGKGYIHITGNTMKKVEQEDIKAWVNQWAASKGFGRAILDMISGTRDLSESVLNELPEVDPDVRTAGHDYQDIFFENEIWRITSDDIRVIKQGNVDTYVWNHKIGLRESGQVIAPKIKNDVFRPNLKRKMIQDPTDATKKIQAPDPYFKITKDAEGKYHIEILNKAPQFFQFLINTCKVHWKDEVKIWAEKNNQQGELSELQRIYSKTDHGITSPYLTDEQNREQTEHLINRIYTMGYLMHRFKFRNRAFMVWCMDYKADSIKDSKGRSGKSIIPQAFEHLKTFATENGRDTNLTKKNHLFADVTSLTDILIINDVHNYLDLGYFYNYVTDNLSVNPKNVAQRTIPFAQAGKILVTSNFGPSMMDDSTLDRILFNLFADWYHSAKDFGSDWRPSDDFGGQMFEDWDNGQWNEYLNFMAQCCVVYFTMDKAQAPMSQIMKRHNMREAGDSFIEWANETLLQYVNAPIVMASQIHADDPTNDYLVHEEVNVGTFIIRSKAKDLFEKYHGGQKIQMNTFTRKLKSWAELKQISINPDHVMPTSGRMIKSVQIGDKKKQEECIFLYSTTIENNPLNEPPL